MDFLSVRAKRSNPSEGLLRLRPRNDRCGILATTNMFSRIIGHEKIISVLRRQRENGRGAHAYLFVGPEGSGRTTVAHAVIAGAAKQSRDEIASPADGRLAMTTVRRLADEKTGKLKSAISIDQIRELRDVLAHTSFDGGKKCVFIEEADWLNAAAANALLKTLEEPRGDTLIVLRAPTVESVPVTIASRCQVIRFGFVPAEAIAAALVRRGLDREEASGLARASNGCPGTAIRLLTDSAYRAERDTAASAFHAIMDASLPRRLALVSAMLPKTEADKATALEHILDVWEETARQRMLAGDGRFVAVLDRLRESRDAMEHNVNPLLALEHIVI